ncbi:hypothetical protein HDU96_009370 [Phlyctochytrium bullatum]|nr:hypothetical protein HDU96_009370 [Phlyctochytrium bullatum]
MSTPEASASAHDFATIFSAETTHGVFWHLEARDLGVCARVSKRWNHIITSMPPSDADYARLYLAPSEVKRVYVGDVLEGSVNRLAFFKKFRLFFDIDPDRLNDLSQWTVEVDLYEGGDDDSTTENDVRRHYANHGKVTIKSWPKEQEENDVAVYFEQVDKCFNAGSTDYDDDDEKFWTSYDAVEIGRYYYKSSLKPEWIVVWVYSDDNGEDLCTFREDSANLVMISRSSNPMEDAGTDKPVITYPLSDYYGEAVQQAEEEENGDAIIFQRLMEMSGEFRVSRSWADFRGLTMTSQWEGLPDRSTTYIESIDTV